MHYLSSRVHPLPLYWKYTLHEKCESNALILSIGGHWKCFLCWIWRKIRNLNNDRFVYIQYLFDRSVVEGDNHITHKESTNHLCFYLEVFLGINIRISTNCPLRHIVKLLTCCDFSVVQQSQTDDCSEY